MLVAEAAPSWTRFDWLGGSPYPRARRNATDRSQLLYEVQLRKRGEKIGLHRYSIVLCGSAYTRPIRLDYEKELEIGKKVGKRDGKKLSAFKVTKTKEKVPMTRAEVWPDESRGGVFHVVSMVMAEKPRLFKIDDFHPTITTLNLHVKAMSNMGIILRRK